MWTHLDNVQIVLIVAKYPYHIKGYGHIWTMSGLSKSDRTNDSALNLEECQTVNDQGKVSHRDHVNMTRP